MPYEWKKIYSENQSLEKYNGILGTLIRKGGGEGFASFYTKYNQPFLKEAISFK